MHLLLIGFTAIVVALGKGIVVEQIRLESSNLLKHDVGVHYQVSEWGEAREGTDLYH